MYYNLCNAISQWVIVLPPSARMGRGQGCEFKLTGCMYNFPIKENYNLTPICSSQSSTESFNSFW